MISFEEWCSGRGYSLEHLEKKQKVYDMIGYRVSDIVLRKWSKEFGDDGYDMDTATIRIDFNARSIKLIADWRENDRDYEKRIAGYRKKYDKSIEDAKSILGL